MKPRVSVIVPTFNSVQFLPRAIQSLLDQTIDPRLMEILIVDDCSQDGTWSMVEDRAARNSRLRAIRLDQFSRGPGRGLNVENRHAKGEWLAFLASDDGYLPEGIESLLGLADQTPCDIASARIDFVDGDVKVTPQIYDAVLPDALFAVTTADHPELLWPPLGFCGRLVRADYIRNADISFPEGVVGEDSVFCTEALLRASAASYCPAVVYEYVRESNRSQQSISDEIDPAYFPDWIATRAMIEDLYSRYSAGSYLQLRYDTDLKHGMAELLRFARRLNLDVPDDQQRLVDTIRLFQDFCSHHQSADLANLSPFQSLLPMLIGDGDFAEALELIQLWIANQEARASRTGTGR